MAKITIKSVLHEKSKYAGMSGVEHGIGIVLTEDIDFQNTSEYKYGGVPITYDGKVADATTPATALIYGFLNKAELQSLSSTYPDFPVTGNEVATSEKIVAVVDVPKVAGTPVYLGNDTFYNDVAGTETVIVGRYINHKQKAGLIDGTGKSYVVEFSV